MEYTNLCEVSADIITKAESIENLLNDGKVDEIYPILGQIMMLANTSSNMGQRMENRLAKYRSAIEGLGFNRTNI